MLILKKRVSRVLPVLLALLLLLPGRAMADDEAGEGERPVISAESAILYEPLTGTVLFEKEPDRQMLIASTTKIMTAMVVLEHCALNEVVTVTPAHAAVEGSTMFLEAWQYYTVEDLLYGLLLASGNDAAAALADHCAGSMEDFAELMNQKAAELGLQNTHFANSHGLDAEGHYSCARDLALITAAAMENPTFCRFFATQTRTIHGHDLPNHNQLLWTLPGCIGGKTGYTNAAGRILVSVTEREGMRLICVTLADPDDWKDHTFLVERAFSEWSLFALPRDRWQQIAAVSGTGEYVRLRYAQPAVLVPKGAEIRLNAYLPRFIFAPVMYGETAGGVEVLADGVSLITVDVVYGETVARSSSVALSAWERFRQLWFLPGHAYYLSK